MKYNPITRRFFLQGVGQGLLALPLLPSLLPRSYAQQAVEDEKFFAMITSGHGGKGHSTDWYPKPFINNFEGSWFKEMELFPKPPENDFAHIMRHSKLRDVLSTDVGHPNGNVDAGKERVSYILGSFLNPYIDKMNMFVGIDGAMHYYGHSRGVYGGNPWFKSKNEAGEPDPNYTWETIDQFFGRSSKFYKDRNNISMPVINLTRWNSYYQDGNQAPRQDGVNIKELYENLFGKYEKESNPEVNESKQQRQYLIDKVLADYKRVTEGAYGPARKMSSEDKNTIKEHAERMYEVQNKFKTVINSCSDVNAPSGDIRRIKRGEGEIYWDLATDLIVAAYQCGSSRVSIFSGNEHFRYKGDYHAEVAHAANNDPEKQLLHNRGFRWQAEHLVNNIVKKMDAIKMADGKTMLDKGLVSWVHEAGDVTHTYHNCGIVTFGSANGFFKTGNLVDYRSLENLGLLKNHQAGQAARPGIPLSRLLANVAQAFGHSPNEYRRFNRPGYGDSKKYVEGGKSHRGNPDGSVPYPKVLRDSLDDKLPIVT